MITLKQLETLGGATLDTITKEPVTLGMGYMVGLEGYGSVHALETLSNASFQMALVTSKIDIALKTFETLGVSAFVGCWVNDDLVYIDLSVHVYDLQQAIALGRINNQIAIYDIVNNCDILVD